MPKMSGIELLQRLRENAIKAPVVFLTGHSLIEHEQTAIGEGALDFIDKSRGVGILVSRLYALALETQKPPANLFCRPL